MDSPVPVLVGPTASGKTEVSLLCAERLSAEILSIDSRQLYRGMEIGSAAASIEDRDRAPHHFVLDAEPTDPVTAGEFGRAAQDRMKEIRERGRVPMLVGGSGLYLRAVLGGLEELPSDPGVRAGLRERAEREGSAALHAELERLDPATAAKVAPQDAQRIIRALEIIALAGRPASALRTLGRETTIPAVVVVLDREWSDLEDRIRRRVEAMVAAGLEEEVRGLLDRGIDRVSAPLMSVGYRETIAMLDGELDRSSWIDTIVLSTRRFAKKQRTWFRGLPERLWLQVEAGEEPSVTATRVIEAWRAEGTPATVE